MREGIGRVGENERIVMIEIALGHEERESGKIARAGRCCRRGWSAARRISGRP